eukprot:CAMPEP_0170522162 /NCGR_PEP_ID=MMETSP0209-20121228/7611_1 /TAXON_ID=665100 ORGANISM="Litonotus pictus, Strain P1" /NCGR_SAMPLE_ID=MMETSP0209 /ASSEMBLY_ACC=CAM_ASM_000301 /LENGTH=300 /DNA_ID=CAMNT_0010809527 /DNA_START=77 /DNA_END=976 /DNA_ORIENTATION=+
MSSTLANAPLTQFNANKMTCPQGSVQDFQVSEAEDKDGDMDESYMNNNLIHTGLAGIKMNSMLASANPKSSIFSDETMKDANIQRQSDVTVREYGRSDGKYKARVSDFNNPATEESDTKEQPACYSNFTIKNVKSDILLDTKKTNSLTQNLLSSKADLHQTTPINSIFNTSNNTERQSRLSKHHIKSSIINKKGSSPGSSSGYVSRKSKGSDSEFKIQTEETNLQKAIIDHIDRKASNYSSRGNSKPKNYKLSKEDKDRINEYHGKGVKMFGSLSTCHSFKSENQLMIDLDFHLGFLCAW